jgi:protoporphyrinogen oxidase
MSDASADRFGVQLPGFDPSRRSYENMTLDRGCAMQGGAGSVGIVGGGMLGMTLAWRLQRLGYRVTLLESAERLGGLTASHTIGGYTWDRFYHVILQTDQHLRSLLEELDLTPLLRWGRTRTGFFTNGRLHSMSTTVEFLTFPALSLADKLRLAATLIYASRIRDWRPLEQIPVAEWLQRLSGRRTFERLWLPLLKSKLGDNYRITSAAFMWATIARMYGARRSGMKREVFGYVEGGYSTILDRLAAQLRAAGVVIRCAAPVVEVRDGERQVEVRLASGEPLSFDTVILSVPCERIRSLCPQLSAAERERLGRVVYQGITCASALLRQPLADFYITNITEPWVPYTAVIEMTALVDRARFGGHSLVYLPRYHVQDDGFWHRSPHEVRELFLAGLERMYPRFRRDDVIAFEVSRVREMLALTTLDYSARCKPPMRTSIPNVYLVNSAQIVNGTLNVNETIALANEAAAALGHTLPARGVDARPSAA